jgi:hypothetical protein
MDKVAVEPNGRSPFEDNSPRPLDTVGKFETFNIFRRDDPILYL